MNISMAFGNVHLNAKEITGCSATNQLIVNINLGDVTNLSDTELNKLVDDHFMVQVSEVNEKSAIQELTCTVTLTAEVNAGVAKGTVSVTVSGPCSEVMAKAKKLLQEAKRLILD